MPARFHVDTSEKELAFEYGDALQGLTKMQTAFVINIINGMTAFQAYGAAGYKSTNYNAVYKNSRALYDNPKIKVALGRIRQAETKGHEITRDKLVEMFLEHRTLALERNNIGPANSAVMGIAKVLGLDVHTQKSEVKHTYEVEQATQELYKMLRTRGKAQQIELQADDDTLDATPVSNVDTPLDVEDAVVIEDQSDATDT